MKNACIKWRAFKTHFLSGPTPLIDNHYKALNKLFPQNIVLLSRKKTEKIMDQARVFKQDNILKVLDS